MRKIRFLLLVIFTLTLLGCTFTEEKVTLVSMSTTLLQENEVKEFKVERKEEPKVLSKDSVIEKAKLDELANKMAETIKEDKEEIDDEMLFASTERITIKGKTHQLRGDISHYGYKLHGSQTATGGRFDQWAMTTAHKTLPFGTIVRVTNNTNGKYVDVKVNDRGPYIKGRTFDLSRGAFVKIAPQAQGVLRSKDVTVRIIKLGNGNRKENR